MRLAVRAKIIIDTSAHALAAQFSGAERFQRRLAKVAALEREEAES